MQNAMPAINAPLNSTPPIYFHYASTVALAALAGAPKPTGYTQALERVMVSLPEGAPFYTPDDVGPLLGITANAFTRHCRQCPRLKSWIGRYQFNVDDPEHMKILRGLVLVILRTGLKLPPAMKVH